MKLQCSKILLLFLPLNILVTSYEHNTNKPYITSHHTQTNRSLCECDTQSSNYNNDEDMKSVKERFDDRTSQRLRKYNERMQDKRQKYKEQRDKNIQKIIEKDKREKSLAEKVEKGCLKCGCALGGGVLPVWGLASGIWYAIVSQHATKLATEAGIKKGLQVGITEITKIFAKYRPSVTVPKFTVDQMLSSRKFTKSVDLFGMIQHLNDTVYHEFGADSSSPFWTYISYIADDKLITDFNTNNSDNIAAVKEAFEKCKAAEFASHTSLLSNNIIASVVTIIIIVLIMVIIYLVLRYRRKKKMKKKAQYTKLLNQ
ncbi:PIR protein [Plasmodium sp. DRC-Itaito]|nr:PIR protein [Plasmodium sp. DRC-Itaito]